MKYILKKLAVAELVKNVPVFYIIQMFFTVLTTVTGPHPFTRNSHWTYPEQAESNNIFTTYFFKISFNIILLHWARLDFFFA
jgi:hypothetical protein